MIRAVSHCRSIFTPAFISDLEKCIKTKNKLPALKQYRPPQNTDPSIINVNFTPLLTRKTLFEHLNFIFMSANDMTESEELIKALGGNVLLLDPLQQDRKTILLSTSSIVMEAKDAALNDYLKTTVAERDLSPTKHADLALALFYVDKTRVFKKSCQSASQSLHGLIQVQDTQVQNTQVQDTQANMSQLPPSLQNIQSKNPKFGDISVFEPSAVPPKLDKTIETPVKVSGDVSACGKSEPSLLVNDVATPNLDTPTSGRKAKTSFFEPSAIPPRLDKTVKTPQQPSTECSKPNISFFEPSAVPPQLEKTVTTPSSSRSGSIPNTSFIEPSAVPLRLDKTMNSSATTTPATSLLKVETPLAPTQIATTQLGATPVVATPRSSIGSNTSLFGSTTKSIATDQSLFTPGSTKHLKTKSSVKNGKSKRKMMSDSDDSDGENPFAVSKSSKSFLFKDTLTSYSCATNKDSKKPRLASQDNCDTVIPHDVSLEENMTTVIKTETNIRDENKPPLLVNVPASINSVQIPCPASEASNDAVTESGSQSLKRELLEKQEPVNKKYKTDSPALSTTSSSSNITVIPDMTQSVWMSRTKSDVEKQFTSLVITDVSVDLLVQRKSSCEYNKATQPIQDSSTVVINFKRFKRKGIFNRSTNVTLGIGEFKKNSRSLLDASQATQVRFNLISTG